MPDEPASPAPATHHGARVPRGLEAPAGPSRGGRFGRMFPSLPAQDFCVDDIDAVIALMRPPLGGGPAIDGSDNPDIPAGYTYLGQFIDHDITFDPGSVLDKVNDPHALVNFRTPRLDLDSVYGAGPSDQPFLYEYSDESNRGVKLLIGRNPPKNKDGDALAEHDLQRNAQERALIGDARNDENLIVSQLHLLFIRFHNAVVERVRRDEGLEGPELFAEAQRLVRWHYQWVVVDDFLRRVVGEDTLAAVLAPAGELPRVRQRFYRADGEPFIPVEFSAAAYRFGHSMVRVSYQLRSHTEATVRIFDPGPRSLAGFRMLPKEFEIRWEMFFAFRNIDPPQRSRRIDLNIAAGLFDLPASVARQPKLPRLNMLRARALELPSGPDVAQAMEMDPLDGAAIKKAAPEIKPELSGTLERAAPLWLYVLVEAQALHAGKHLGPVGGRIVAEVLLGLIESDPHSWLARAPAWEPDYLDPETKRFRMRELIAFAGYDPRTGAWS